MSHFHKNEILLIITINILGCKMSLAINYRVKFKTTRQFVVAGVLLGIVFIFFSNGASELYPIINGAVVGLIVGILLAILELVIFARGAKKMRFIWLLSLRTMLYFILITVIIFNVVVASRMIRLDMRYFEVLGDPDFNHYLYKGSFSVAVVYTLIFAFSINFVRMISRKMGQGMLLSYILGTYYTPVHQARIIMFVSIVDSKKIVHDLGSLKFHKFLNDLFYDFTLPVVSNRGIIYEYVEDLMVVTWAMNKGLENANCIRTYFELQNSISEKKEEYFEKYGFIPQIQASLHTGSLVRAEIGEVKSQIVFHGDTMNTCARILGKCIELNAGLVVSDHITHMTGLPREYSKTSVGEILLQGKQEGVTLFEIADNIVDRG